MYLLSGRHSGNLALGTLAVSKRDIGILVASILEGSTPKSSQTIVQQTAMFAATTEDTTANGVAYNIKPNIAICPLATEVTTPTGLEV